MRKHELQHNVNNLVNTYKLYEADQRFNIWLS